MELINTRLLVQPWNWVIIAGTAAFWLIFLAVLVPQPPALEGK